MSTGIVLIIIGAVLAFAVRIDGSWMNVHAFGAILILGGMAFIARSMVPRREVVVTEEDTDEGAESAHEHRVVVEKRLE